MISLILAACTAEPTVSPTAAPDVPSEEVVPTPVPTPTATPSPDPGTTQPAVVLAGSGDQLGESAYTAIQSLLQGLAEKDNLIFTSVDSLEPADLTENIKIVVVLPPDPGMAALAAAAENIQFVAVGIPGLQPAGNLSVIAENTISDRQGFAAGYLAAVISDEWRTGMITVGDTESGQMSRQGFINGITYYCGLCRSPYPPFYSYPILVDLPSTAGPAEAQSAAETIISQAVNTVFVYPGAGDQAMLERLAEAGLKIIGWSKPPPGVDQNWVATVRADPLAALNEIWPDLLNGQGGLELTTVISLVDRNDSLFSPGRQLLVEEFLVDMEAGFIDPGVREAAP